ncbi:MAG: hypothetical protein ACI381_01980 [Candidatus Methanomethylophilaceae archaeon]
MFSEVTCPKCGHRFETDWTRWNDEEITETEYRESWFDECPECGCEFVTWCTYELKEHHTKIV